jgi:oligopeptidase A
VADLRDLPPAPGPADPQAWDWPYISEKLKEARYAFSEQDVKQYFTAPKVLAGLFKIIETLFEVSIRRDTRRCGTPGEFYRIERTGGRPQGHAAGRPVLPRPARAHRQARRRLDGRRAHPLAAPRHRQPCRRPVAHLVCNFADGVDGKPPLLTHDDVTTLFHEFGHGLHHMLTQVNERDVVGHQRRRVGRRGAAQPVHGELLLGMGRAAHMTAHVDTGEPLPRALFDKMIAAKNFQSGMQTLRQIEFALFDMLLHTEHDPAQDFMPLLDLVRSRSGGAAAAGLQPHGAHLQPHLCRRLRGGLLQLQMGRSAERRCLRRFEETSGNEDGLPSPETGRKYRQAILEAGGSRPAMESFKAFRGREPSLDALLRHQGMA